MFTVDFSFFFLIKDFFVPNCIWMDLRFICTQEWHVANQ